jgi:Fe-S-cluster containining protein
MEFTIDFELVRKLARTEYQRATTEIAELGIMEAFQRSLRRHDQQLTHATDANTLACKQGCSWCCHFSIDIRAIEAFNIAAFMKDNFSAERIQQIRSEMESNRALLSVLDEEQRMQQNVKCPFLSDGSCSIYAARPQTCRNYHATDVAGCKQSYEQPNNEDIAPEYAPITFQTGAAQVDAFAKAMKAAGYPTDVYELNTAVLEVLNDSHNSWRCFTNKLAPFNLSGHDVPLEFAEMEE